GVKLRFTGRSEVVTPEGELLVRLSASKPEEGVVTVDAQTAKNKRLNALNDLFSDRRVNSYTA
ncbi:MAG TPA: acyltransferase, partial [Bacteroidota bacterium]